MNKPIRSYRALFIASLFVAWGAIINVASAGLLGVVPGHPLFTYDNLGVTNFNSGTNDLDVDATPLDLVINAGDPPWFVVDPRSVAIRVSASGASCDAMMGTGMNDLEVTGDVFDQAFVLVMSGVLLTGDIVAMGSEATSPTSSTFDFRFTNAGGQLVTDGFWPTGQDIGVTLNADNSDFPGDCLSDFSGGAKGQIGPIPPDVPPVVCDLDLAKFATPDTLGPFNDVGEDTDSDSHVDFTGGGDSDDSDSSSELDSADSTPAALNCGCKDRVKGLTVRYNLPVANLVEVRRITWDGVETLFGPQLLQPGEEFTFPVRGRKIEFAINGVSVEMLRTSCWNPIGAGQEIGNGELVVVTGISKFYTEPGATPIPLCPVDGSTCGPDQQVTYTYDIINNGTTVNDIVVFDDQLGVIGSTIPSIGPGEMVTLQETTCIFETTVNVATATGTQGTAPGEVVCASDPAEETVTVLELCPNGHSNGGDDSDSDSGIDGNLDGDSDDSDSDSGAGDCDNDEPRSCFGSGFDSDSDSGVDWDDDSDTDDTDSDSGPNDCDGDSDPANPWWSKWYGTSEYGGSTGTYSIDDSDSG